MEIIKDKVSVAIPCRNEVKYIEGCVEAILKSDYPNDKLEVIVVDGMSVDGTRDILKTLSDKYSNVRMVDNPEQKTPYAFNYGVKAGDGEFVQIVGSRNLLDANYIKEGVRVLKEYTEVGCVGGNYVHTFDNEKSKCIAWAMESKIGVGASNYRVKQDSGYVDTVGIPMYRKSIFDELGYFDERLTRNQDDDYNFRATKAGYRMYYNADVQSLYYVRGNFSKLFKQMFQYGYWKIFVNKKHKTLTTLRQLVPSCFLLFLICGLALSLLWKTLFFIYLPILVLYLILGIVSGIKVTQNLKEVFYIQSAITSMHIGYGMGYLLGIYHFLILGRGPDSKLEMQTT